MTRIERASVAYKATALPLSYTSNVERLEPTLGIEPRSVPYQGTILPLNYRGSGATGRTRTFVTGLRNPRSAC